MEGRLQPPPDKAPKPVDQKPSRDAYRVRKELSKVEKTVARLDKEMYEDANNGTFKLDQEAIQREIEEDLKAAGLSGPDSSNI